jgi:prepilin-type N-terminal cleavage/methylation domain-containing protein
MTAERIGDDTGFSMIEVMLVVAVGSVVAGMAAFSAHHAVPEFRANAAQRVVESQLITAREMAITQRRTVEVQFIPPNEIRTTRVELNGARTELNHVYFEGGATFLLVPGVPDTPDGFGNRTAVSFANASQTLFLSDGSFVDQSGQPASGTVSLGIAGRTTTARAVTVFGGTGRVTGYRWTGSAWLR